MTVNTDITSGTSLSATGESADRPVPVSEVPVSLAEPATQPHVSSVVSDPAQTDAIEFRVSRSGESRRRLRLTGNRYTFGNADGCTIRLNDPSLRPMHAVLIRDESRVMVRTYSVPIEVNGDRTTEATLKVGDVWRLGVYEFELLGDSAPSSTTTPPGTFSSSPAGTTAARRRELPMTDEVVWRERLRREVDQWRQRQEDCDRRESRIDEREAELRSRESELWSRADNLHRRESRVQSQEVETFQLYDEFAHRQQEVMRLREESQHHQAEMHRLESEFREQEFEYRRRLAEATSQLDQSKLQAEAASQAVARMREQFDALNGQIEELSKDQHKIEVKESEQAEEFQRVREEIEAARAEAERSRDDSDRQRAEAEARVAQLESEIERLQANQGADDQQYQAQLEASQVAADQMSQQIAELQKSVADASEESSQLRTDYEQACEKVLQLEALVSESQQRGDEDRDQWAVEAEQLRAEVDRLSTELTEANHQVAEVRDANEILNTKLCDVQQERDDARIERDARPTTEAFQSLREELEAATDQLTEMKLQYDEILNRLQHVESPQVEEEPSVTGSGFHRRSG